MNGMDFDLLAQARKPSRAFAISWKKLVNHRVHLRSPGTSSQNIAIICDLLGQARKPLRAFSISWEKLANHRVRFRGSNATRLKFVTVASARDPHKFPQQLLRAGGRRPHLSCS